MFEKGVHISIKKKGLGGGGFQEWEVSVHCHKSFEYRLHRFFFSNGAEQTWDIIA